MYYFAVPFSGVALEPVRKGAVKLFHLNEQAIYYRILQVLKTWIIIFIGELFFRANGLCAGLSMFRSMFQDFEIQKFWDGTLLNLGLDQADYLAIVAGGMVVAIVGIIKERNLLDKLFSPYFNGVCDADSG